jgi:hypothetical protein
MLWRDTAAAGGIQAEVSGAAMMPLDRRMRRRPSWLIHAVCRHASNGGLPASTRHDDGSRFTGTAWIWYDRSSARSTASTTGAATQSEAERRCMQPMAHAWAMRQGARRGWPWAGNAASGCASPDGGTMHACERVDIAIGHRGGREGCAAPAWSWGASSIHASRPRP